MGEGNWEEAGGHDPKNSSKGCANDASPPHAPWHEELLAPKTASKGSGTEVLREQLTGAPMFRWSLLQKS